MPTVRHLLGERVHKQWVTVGVDAHTYELEVTGFGGAYRAALLRMSSGGAPDLAIPAALGSTCICGVRGLTWPPGDERAGAEVTLAEYRRLIADPRYLAIFSQAYKAVWDASQEADNGARE